MKNKKITELECSFDKNRNGVSFHGDGSAKITLDVDGLQMAEASKLLLLVGKLKTFKVVFYETGNKNEDSKEIKL